MNQTKGNIQKKQVGGRFSVSHYTIQLCVYRQIIQDLMTEFQNLPSVKSKFKYETAMINERIMKSYKWVRRSLTQEKFSQFEDAVCEIVDQSEPDIEHVKKLLRIEMVNKVSYEGVDAAIIIGMLGGFMSTNSYIRKAFTGKSDSDMEEALRYLHYIDRHIGFRRLNDDVEPDYEKCRESMDKMFGNICDRITVWLYN